MNQRFRRPVCAIVILIAGTALSPPAPAGTGTDSYGDPLPEGAVRRFGSLRFRADRRISRLAFSPDGKRLAMQDLGGVTLWTCPEGKRLWQAAGALPLSGCFSADGTQLVLLDDRRDPSGQRSPASACLILDAATGEEVRALASSDNATRVCAAAWAPTGKTLALGRGDGTIELLDAAAGRTLSRLEPPKTEGRDGPPRSILGVASRIVLSRDGRTLAAAHGLDGCTLSVWDVPTRTLRHHRQFFYHVFDIALTDGGRTLRWAADPHGEQWPQFFTLDISPGADLAASRTGYSAGSARELAGAFSADGRRYAHAVGWSWMSDSDSRIAQVRCFDMQGNKAVSIGWKVPGEPILALSADGRVLATGTGQAIRFWDADTGLPLQEAAEHEGAVLSIALTADESILATGGADGTIRIRRVADGKGLGVLDNNAAPVEGLAFLPDGKTLVARVRELAGTYRKTAVRFWDWRGGRQTGLAFAPDGTGPMVPSRDGRYVAYTSGGTVEVIDVMAQCPAGPPFGDYVQEFAGRLSFYVKRGTSAYTPTTPSDWPELNQRSKLPKGSHLLAWECAALAADGKHVLFSKRDELKLIDPAAGKEGLQFTPVARFEDEPLRATFWHVAFSADGKRVVGIQDAVARKYGSGPDNADQVIRVWDAASRAEVAALAGHRGAIRAVAFAEGGRALLTAGDDSTILLWDLQNAPEPAAPPAEPKAVVELLARGHADRAAYAMRRASGTPAQAAAVYQAWLAGGPSLAEAAESIGRLGSDDLAARYAAIASLATLGPEKPEPVAGLLVRTLLAEKVKPATVQRICALLGEIRHLCPATRRELVRLAKLLEWTGDQEARGLLARMAERLPADLGGAPAREGLERIAAGTNREDLAAMPPLPEPRGSGPPAPPMQLLALREEPTPPPGPQPQPQPQPEPETRPSPAVPPPGLEDEPLPEGAIARIGTSRLHHGGAICSIEFSRDGKRVLAASRDGTARVWDVATGKELQRLPTSVNTCSATFFPDGTRVGVVSGWRGWSASEAKVYDLQSGEPKFDLPRCRSIAFSPDGKTMAVGYRLCDPLSGQVTQKLTRRLNAPKYARDTDSDLDDRAPRALCFSPDGKWLLGVYSFENSYDRSTTLSLWDVEKAEEVFSQTCGAKKMSRDESNGGVICGVAFDPAGRTLLTCHEPGRIGRWPLDKPESRTLTDFGSKMTVQAAVFLPDGKRLAAVGAAPGQEAHLFFLDAATGEISRRLEPLSGVGCAACSPDGSVMAFAGEGNTVVLFDARTGTRLPQSAGFDGPIEAIDLSPDGRSIAMAYVGFVHVRRLADDAELCRLGPHDGPMTDVAFSPDGTRVAVATGNRLGWIWRLDARGLPTKCAGNPALLDKEYANCQVFWASDAVLDVSGVGRFDTNAGVRIADYVRVRMADSSLTRRFGQFGGHTYAYTPDRQLRYEGGLRLYCGETDEEVATLPFGVDPNAGAVVRGPARVRPAPVVLEPPRGALRSAAFSRDGRLLAIATDLSEKETHFASERAPVERPKDGLRSPLQEIRVIDVLTNVQLAEFQGHQGRVMDMRFSRDAKTLYTAGEDAVVLAWKLPAPAAREKPAEPGDPQQLWQALAADKLADYYPAMERIAAFPEKLPAMIEAEWGSLAAESDAEVLAAVKALDSEDPSQPSSKLYGLGARAFRGLLRALLDPASPSRLREQAVKYIYDPLRTRGPKPEDARRLFRIIPALEAAGTPEAKALLKRFSERLPEAIGGDEAARALQRLARSAR